jgi:putative ABC transport system substrate-binding protein
MAIGIGKREFIALLGGAVALAPHAARAQQSDRIRNIGVLINERENGPQIRASLTAFRQELERLSWSEGRNVRFDTHFTQGKLNEMQELAKKMVASQPDVILVHTTPLVAAVQKETRTIPIVFVNASDPVGSGFVASLATWGQSYRAAAVRG